MKHYIEKEIWSCEYLDRSLEDFITFIRERAKEYGPGEIVVRANSDCDTGDSFNVVHRRKETDKEYEERIKKERLKFKLKESPEYKNYLRLRKHFEGR